MPLACGLRREARGKGAPTQPLPRGQTRQTCFALPTGPRPAALELQATAVLLCTLCWGAAGRKHYWQIAPLGTKHMLPAWPLPLAATLSKEVNIGPNSHHWS